MGAADVETKFVSVERVAEYMRLEGETEGSFEVVENWPQGEVKLEAETRQQWINEYRTWYDNIWFQSNTKH